MSTVNVRAAGTATAEERVLVTGEELLAMGDVGRCELVRGEIVRMSPTGERHGTIENNIAMALTQFVRQHRLGRVSVGEVGVLTARHPDTVRGADVLFISNARTGKQASVGFLDVAPDLVVEVMSPDDRWSSVMKKLEEYFAVGVRLVWVANPDTETVYAYRSPTDVRRFSQGDVLPGDDVLPGFALPVAEIFRQ